MFTLSLQRAKKLTFKYSGFCTCADEPVIVAAFLKNLSHNYFIYLFIF
jgi:hypothetical protein